MGSTGTHSPRHAKVQRAAAPVNQASEEVVADTSAPICPPIADAIARVTDAPPAGIAHIRTEDLARQLGWVRDACMYGAAESSPNGAIASLRRHLVDLVRQEVVTHWESETPDPGTMLDALVRLEQAHRACESPSEQTLAAELAGQGGANLVMEVAHDMRSPLTSILFLAEALHKGHSGPLTPLQRRQLGIVYGASLGLTNLVSDLIEMNRHGERRRSEQPTPFAVNSVLRSVHDLVRPTVEEKKLEFVVDPLGADRRMGFPIELSRVLLNLTTNALKFTTEGGVTLSARPNGGSRVLFSVADTGPGIESDKAAVLYQPIRHEPRRDTGYAFSGTGLGLAICQRLVRWMGSDLTMESGQEGTCFSFELDLPPASSV